jgi:uncharacterized protein DUF3761
MTGVMRLALLLCLLAALLAAAADASSAPPGATARCRDGTYSFSKHRSGTCSHHGGVAAWLGASSARVALGRTILLGPRTRSAGCRLGVLPDRRCSPGAFYGGLTRDVLCGRVFHTSAVRNVPQTEKFAVEREYGLAPAYYGRSLEIDHIVPLELGGSNAIANLFPERGYAAKDRLENRLHQLVCAGRMTLGAARVGIARNWTLLYRHVFGAAPR